VVTCVQSSRSRSAREFVALVLQGGGGIDRPNREAGNPIGMYAGLREGLVDTGLIGAERRIPAMMADQKPCSCDEKGFCGLPQP
jgi:hypothetical protein